MKAQVRIQNQSLQFPSESFHVRQQNHGLNGNIIIQSSPRFAHYAHTRTCKSKSCYPESAFARRSVFDYDENSLFSYSPDLPIKISREKSEGNGEIEDVFGNYKIWSFVATVVSTFRRVDKLNMCLL